MRDTTNIPTGGLMPVTCICCPFCLDDACTQPIDVDDVDFVTLPKPLPLTPPEFCSIQHKGILVFHSSLMKGLK